MNPERTSELDSPSDLWANSRAAATPPSTSAPKPDTSANNAHPKLMENLTNDCDDLKKVSIESSETPATHLSQSKRTRPRLAFVHCKKCHHWRPKCKPHDKCEPNEQPSSTPMDAEPTRRQPAPAPAPTPAPATSWVPKRRQVKKRMRLIDDFRKRSDD
ncbi:hypothetical protein FGRMN_3177 [Fusarium graminum]|nr:hypothetical protein FGRMN_3177 [Fusarium graminum]